MSDQDNDRIEDPQEKKQPCKNCRGKGVCTWVSYDLVRNKVASMTCPECHGKGVAPIKGEKA